MCRCRFSPPGIRPAMHEHDPAAGQLFTNRNIMIGALVFWILLLLLMPSSPAQAAYAAFFAAVLIFQYFLSRNQLDGLRISRAHLPRVFEADRVEVTLTLSTNRQLPLQMLQLEDQFLASLDIRQRHLIPLLAAGWQVHL